MRFSVPKFKSIPPLLISFVAGCVTGTTHAPRRATATMPALAEKAAYVASPQFSVHYGLFRDVATSPWGEGKVLAAYWQRDFDFESSIAAVDHSKELDTLLVESARRGTTASILHVIDSAGVTVTTTANRSSVRALAVVGDGESTAILVHEFDRLHILRGQSPTSSVGPVEAFITANLDGIGGKEFIIHSSSGSGLLSAYSVDGRLLWTVPGIQYVSGFAAGRLPGTKGDCIVAFDGGFRSASFKVFNGRGNVVFSTTTTRHHRLATLGGLDDGSGLVTVSYSYPNTRDSLMIHKFGPAGLELIAQADLGWARAQFLLTADLQGDGRKEIVVGTENGWVLIFSSEGKFLSERSFSELGGISHIVAGDINGDGKEELLVAQKDIPPSLYAVGVVPDPGPWKP